MQTQDANVPTNICAILCDVGGVIIQRAQTPALQQWEKRFALTSRDLSLSVWLCEAAQRATRGLASVDEVWREIQQTYMLTNLEVEAFRNDFVLSDYADPEFVHFLHGIRKTRKIALLSNAWPGAREIFGDEFGLKAVSDMMLLSYEEGLAKPERQIYALAAEKLQLPYTSILFIDDYPPNVAAAQECGMHGVVFETREQTIADVLALLDG
jgi:HAD superfamily hydrolase (TIGR01509 family)